MKNSTFIIQANEKEIGEMRGHVEKMRQLLYRCQKVFLEDLGKASGIAPGGLMGAGPAGAGGGAGSPGAGGGAAGGPSHLSKGDKDFDKAPKGVW